MTNSLLPWMQVQEKTGKPVRVMIVGDLILDEYLDGNVSRISPEAPVPVHLVKSTKRTTGGAANSARNVQLAGGLAVVVSVLGEDDAGHQLAQLLDADGVSTKLVVFAKNRVTTRKTRVTAGRQQIVRIDWEVVHPIEEDVQEKLLAILKEETFDALLVSDYAKGCLPEKFVRAVLALAKGRGIPSVVDPKGHMYDRYRDAFVVTPNRMEACEALGLKEDDKFEPALLAQKLQERFGFEKVLLTLGSQGMLLREQTSVGYAVAQMPTVARDVFDVSGAGDTVAGVLALSLGSGCAMRQSVELANLAAGRVVEKWGTQPITRAELEEELLGQTGETHKVFSTKIHSVNRLKELLGSRGKRQKRVVFTNGCFDILHAGHVTYLRRASEKADVLVVAINSDQSVRRLKGQERPIFPLEERMQVMESLGFVTYVTSFEEDTPLKLIIELEPDILVKGADWTVEQIAGGKEVLAGGGKVETIELVPGVSTTAAVQKIRKAP